MKIENESYYIDTSEQPFVRIDYSATVFLPNGPRSRAVSVWFERANLGWIVRSLRELINVYGVPEQRIQSGSDSLRVDESGPEPAPIISIFNKRPADAPHAGAHLIQLTKPLAGRLLAELEQL